MARNLYVVQQAVAYYLGIDGGGSKTTCLAGDETSTLGRGGGGGSNAVRSGEPAAGDALRQAVAEACAQAKVSPAKITRTVAGIAGAGRTEVREFAERVLREAVGGQLAVVTDAHAALHDAFAEGPGVVVVAGTGSIAWARNAGGETARAGGWGWAISDAGSGPWIGRAAVAAVFQALDRGDVAGMERSILQSWQLADYQQLVVAANRVPPPDFGALLPLVAQAANGGDALAAELFLRAGRELAAIARLAASRVFRHGESVPVAMSGGAFAHAPNLREAFGKSLRGQLPKATLLPNLADPALGALNMARNG